MESNPYGPVTDQSQLGLMVKCAFPSVCRKKCGKLTYYYGISITCVPLPWVMGESSFVHNSCSSANDYLSLEKLPFAFLDQLPCNSEASPHLDVESGPSSEIFLPQASDQQNPIRSRNTSKPLLHQLGSMEKNPSDTQYMLLNEPHCDVEQLNASVPNSGTRKSSEQEKSDPQLTSGKGKHKMCSCKTKFQQQRVFIYVNDKKIESMIEHEVVSRGGKNETMLSKTVTVAIVDVSSLPKKGSDNFLEKSKRLGCSVIYLPDILKFASSHKQCSKIKSSAPVTALPEGVIRLDTTGAVIKFEDKSLRYKPEFKVFSTFPALNYDSRSSCAFHVPNMPRPTVKKSSTVMSRSSYCEYCNLRCQNVQEHCNTNLRRQNMDATDFSKLDLAISQSSLSSYLQKLKKQDG